MEVATTPQQLSPCGLNCALCVYGKMDGTQGGCPGCELRMDCPIRTCVEKSACESCDQCESMPCYSYLQGYQCMKEHYTY